LRKKAARFADHKRIAMNDLQPITQTLETSAGFVRPVCMHCSQPVASVG